MHLKKAQKWVKDDWERHSKERPEEYLQLIYLFEELGEMAEAIRKKHGKKTKKVKIDLEEEMGDVLISLCTVANQYDVDLEKAFLKSKKKIQQRHKKGL
ncbi:MAG: nucleotide pyrophosphohydrolase [Candidatus Gerdarchaeota archaeon]|uniref:Nucleotide pyrophosphohydrolase n=1 Tax=candidate division Kazan bacterium TaxID=2202143 RepID=A0A420ZBG0_UNCK3|nr:MAG: nucleotide pyrophosphohydrolase [candidate division Kazan bacterium]RLI68405.1 MAG: nucleotide pyrophosphohydrolase [Candidatus Gerdarchaeota archaeon]